MKHMENIYRANIKGYYEDLGKLQKEIKDNNEKMAVIQHELIENQAALIDILEDNEEDIEGGIEVKELNKGKQVILLMQSNGVFDSPVAMLLVDMGVDIEEVEKEIEEIKKEYHEEWQVTDIVENLSIDAIEMVFEVAYI